jgi:hypothetical protein
MAKRLYIAKPQAIRAVDETGPEQVRHWCPAALARAGPAQLVDQIAALAVQAEKQVDR